ncbi:FitA-like ribbon-helix-helix domain-containing protein [Cupriavidus sp. RAF12]|uniref:FitA-like ribbon-helix-helix domain-containing protein n=1 Tax=Cupriavidus sp. RAF12 TaxID=3233050 RepID=UPI003F917693
MPTLAQDQPARHRWTRISGACRGMMTAGSRTSGKPIMPTLTVRNLDDDIVIRLRQQAAMNGRSAEAEHRAILAQALRGTPRKSLAAFVAEPPRRGARQERRERCPTASVRPRLTQARRCQRIAHPLPDGQQRRVSPIGSHRVAFRFGRRRTRS